jgi:DNA-binding transcriptional ArsR family regulator
MSRSKGKCAESKTSPGGQIATPASRRGGSAKIDTGASLREVMAITKALADEQRVRVMQALQRGEVCVCQIVEMLGLATSTVSKHMSILKQARLVDSRKEGRWMYYRLADDEAPEVVRQAIAWIACSLAGDPQVQRDRQQLAAICNSDPHELCVTQVTGKNARS